MPLNNPNFQLDVSKELIRLQQQLLELQDLDELENVRFDDGSGTYVYPPPSQRAPLSQDQYDDLMEEHAARRPKTAIPQTQQAITNLRQQSLQQYNQLKQALQNDLQSTGYNGPPILDFDDNSLRIEIGCGFKEFLDRFATAMPVVRQTVATDPNDERPLQDIFREYATPRVMKEYEDAFRDSLQEQRDLGDQAYNDPQNPIDLQGATTGEDVVTAVFGGNTSQPGICLDDNHGSPQGPEFLTENMDAMQQSGVTTLFIEHFWQEQQQMLDDYLSGLPMDPVLDKAISKLDKPFTDKTPNHKPLRTMLDEAKAKNIRVVGLDSYQAKATQRHPLTEDRRVAAFNDTAAKVVQREKGNGKFLLLAGSAHNNTDEGGFPGLGQMLGIPALKIDKDSGEIVVSKESNPRKMRTESEQAYYEAFMDAVFKANPDSFKGDGNAVKSRCENIRKAADKLTRKIGPMLGAIDPAKAIQLAEEAADRVSDQIRNGAAALGGTDADAAILTAAEGPAEYIDAVKQLKEAIESGRGDEVLRIVQSIPDDRILLESISKFGTITLPEGTSLLHAAAQGKNPNLAKELLARGMKPDHRNADGNTAMHLAASNMASNAHRLFEDVFTQLVDAGATINLENQRGDTPVHLLRNLQYTTSKSNENSGPLKSMETLLTKLSQDPTFAAAKACRPGNLEQLITACYHGETAEVNQLALNDPILNQKLRGRAAIHAAAEGGHLSTLQALVSKGADIKIKGPSDRNVLHIQCSAGIDDGPLAAFIIQTMGASSSERDTDGRTPLMLAAENGLSGPAREMLASPHKVFFNAADNTGMTPFMYSVLKSDIGEGKCEQEFYSAFPELDSDGPGKPVSVVQMLKWMTNVDDPEAIPDELLEQIYQELYDDPVLRPVLEVAARSGSGPRTTDPNRFGESALRINASNGSGPAGGGGQGNYMPFGNRLNFGAKQNHGQPQGKGFWLDSVKGTLIHELTHHAAAITYDNDAIPVPKGQGNGQTDPQKSQAYVTAFEEDVRNNSHLAMTEEEQRVVLLVSARLTTYQKELQLPGRLLSGGENMQVELIVGISQAIAELGLPLVQKMYPKLSKHYMDVFAKDVEDRCTENDLHSPDLDDNLGVKNRSIANSPDKLFASPKVYNADKIWEFIEKEFTFAKGVLSPSFQTSSQDGVPVWNLSCLQLDTADKNLLERLKPLVTKMLEKELSNSDLPPQFATDRIRELVRTVSEECQKFDTNSDPKTEGKKLLTSLKQATDTFTTNASQDFEQDYLASTRQRLARMTTKDYTLSARDIAELTVVRASDTANQLASMNDAVSINPKKLSQIIDFLESKLAELMKTDENLRKSPEKYIDKYVQALVKDKDFFVKKKGKASGHVSAKVSGVKSLWKSKLRKIKV